MEPIKRIDVASQVADKIKEYIQEEGLAYGLKLPSEKWLCEELEVSRSSLREGFRLLQAQGFLIIKPGKGAFVSSPLVAIDRNAFYYWISQHKISYHDLMVVRKVLENLAIMLAIENIDSEQIRALTENVKKTESLVGNIDNYKQLAVLDEQFHHIIFEASKNKFLMEINKYMEEQLLVFRYSMMQLPENHQNTLDPHKTILKSILSHDAVRCIHEMSGHIDLADTDMRKVVEKVTS